MEKRDEATIREFSKYLIDKNCFESGATFSYEGKDYVTELRIYHGAYYRIPKPKQKILAAVGVGAFVVTCISVLGMIILGWAYLMGCVS